MSITVRDILMLPVMRDSAVIAGEDGLANPVRGIALMESHDSVEFVTGDTIILTNARALAHYPNPLPQLVKRLKGQRVAGIALKKNRYLSTIPQEMLDVADKVGFPVILVGERPSPTQIINAITYEIFRTEAYGTSYVFDDDILKNLAIGTEDASTAKSRMLSLGWDIKQKAAVVAMWAPGGIGDDAFVKARAAAEVEYGFSVLDTKAIVMLQDDDEDEDAFRRRVAETFGRTAMELKRLEPGISLHAGVSTGKNIVLHLYRSYQEALSALCFAVADRKPNALYRFDRLGIFSILLNPKNSNAFNQVVDDALGGLQRYDKRHGSMLFETLVAYAECDEQVNQAAEALGVHYNTVRHRLKEIKRFLSEIAFDSDQDYCLATMCQMVRWMKSRQRLRKKTQRAFGAAHKPRPQEQQGRRGATPVQTRGGGLKAA
ncbi:MAG TPA: PucR family transcriptional regulator ligand-binding domain-containing protein [Candidatus Rubneribacter avistercoris]|nr:PucR family transcriptional regulator ligand-binding domain-containing protein [Candidatus Rubneribacter avistercoris]